MCLCILTRTCWRTHQWATQTACPCRWPWPNWRRWPRSSTKRRGKPTSAARSDTLQRPWTNATSTRCVCVCVCPEVHVCDHHTVRRSAFLTHEVILCAFFFFFLFAWDWLELMIYSLHTLMSFKLFSTCCGISLCPSVGGYPALELHIFFNSSLAWIAYS